MKDIKLLCFFIFLVVAARAQSDSIVLKEASGKTLKRLGKSALQQNDPGSATVYLEAYLKQNKTDAKTMYLLGTAYMKMRDYERAQHVFLKAYTTDKEKAPEALYYHAQMQKSNNLYDSAKINFQKFKKEYKGSDKLIKKQAGKEIVFCDSVQQLAKNERNIIIQHLDTTINKVNAEGAPFNLDDNTLIYSSLRTDKQEYVIEDDTAKVKTKKLYQAKRRANVWHFAGEYGPGLNADDFNNGNACFSPDRKRVYFTRCKLNFEEEMICAIYVSEKNGTEWSEPVKLPKEVNDPKYTSTMPAVTNDPVKGNDVIYFVSNTKKGKGGLDIWYTVYDKKNKVYKEPRNAGGKINTSQNEMSPFFDTETRALYFSSDGLGGFGGYDIFKAIGDGKKWTSSENIGLPINTGADDIYYTISTNREEGFFVSNRKGGNALKNSTCCDDIYYYKLSQYIKLKLKGTVTEMLDKSAVVANAVIEVYIKDKKSSDKFLVKTITTDNAGNYETSVEPGQDYYLVVKKNDYLGASDDVSTRDITTSGDIDRDLQMIKKPKEPIHLPNIQYEFDKSDIMASSKPAIDTTVLKLMQNNPELIVEIESHTDSKGSDQFNMKLSQKRAESVVNYMISKGIDAKRLKAVGYGESKPIAPNENSDGSDNPDGRAKNRRTDFKIVGVIDAEIIKDSETE